MAHRNGLTIDRQRYRLRADVVRETLTVCPEWVRHEGVYEGDIDPSSQDCVELRIRLFHPTDGELSFLVDEGVLEEVA